jgi:hypothetical protein
MRDEQDLRLLTDHREAVCEGIDGLLASIMRAFQVLHRIEWAAPWKASQDIRCS